MPQVARLVWSLVVACLGLVFALAYMQQGTNAWQACYALALIAGFFYLWTFRRNFFSTAPIFVALSCVAITFPAVPYLFFDLKSQDFFFDSIYINSLGLFFFLAIVFLKSPAKAPSAPKGLFLRSTAWDQFYKINRQVCLISFPFVLLAITAAGAWGAFLNLGDSGFDRIANMKGLGPLMIFSVLNVASSFFWALGVWVRGKRVNATLLLMFVLYINGFTHGRGNLIFIFFASLLFYLAVRGMNKKILVVAFLGGLAIILLKLTRGGVASDIPWQILFFLHFAGDFDSLNNCTALIEYTKENGFFGFYHIWSNILVYIPRGIFPDKPHDIGGLYLNTYLFPGVYLGAEGGTGLSLGFQGTWYAVAGLPSLIFGNVLLGWCLSSADRIFSKTIKKGVPTVLLIAYIMLIGQSVIIYRDGFYAFLNVAFYMAMYLILYTISVYLRGRNGVFVSSRTVGTP